MIGILNFIFQDFWHFIGTIILLMVLISAIPSFSWSWKKTTDKKDETNLKDRG